MSIRAFLKSGILSLLALIFCLSSLSVAQAQAPLPAPTQVEGTGQLLVRLTNGTAGSTARLEDIEVRVFVFEGTSQLFEATGMTGPGGVRVFKKVPLQSDAAPAGEAPTGEATGRRYIVSALFQGVIYVAHGEGAAVDGDALDIEVKVFESTGSLKNVKMEHFHMVVAPATGGDGYSVSEILMVQNSGDRAVIGGDGTTTTLALDAPDGLQDFQVVEGVLSRHVGLGEGIIAYSGPLQPGETRMVFNYKIPGVPNWFYRRRFPVAAEQVSVFAPKGGPAILSSQLSMSEEVDIEGTAYVRYAMTDAALRSGGLKFEVSGAGAGIGEGGDAAAAGASPLDALPKGAGFMLAIFASLALAGMLIHPLFKPAPESLTGPGEFVTRAEARRMALNRKKESGMDAVREIDFDYQTGKLSEGDYANLRQRYKAETIEALRALEALDAEEQAAEAAAAPSAPEAAAPSAAAPSAPEASAPSALVAAAPSAPAAAAPSAPAPGASTRPGVDGGAGTLATEAVAAAFCHSCGARAQAGDRFCSACGTQLRGRPKVASAPAPDALPGG